MAIAADISALYQEFTEALVENSVGLVRRGRLAKHFKYSEHEYFLAVETASLDAS